MPRKKHKVARYQVSLNEPQNKMLEEMMKEDAQTEVAPFIGFCIVSEHKRRQEEKNKRPVGRPKKEGNDEGYIDDNVDAFDFSDDLPKNILWYGKMIGQKEYDHYGELQKMFKPK